jgi:hypothetical protein
MRNQMELTKVKRTYDGHGLFITYNPESTHRQISCHG